LPSGSPPEFFIDRSLGRHIVPDALRAAGATVHTMADVYGERISQGLSDEEWLRNAGRQGWVVLMKDAKVRHRPAQRLAIAVAVHATDVRAWVFRESGEARSRAPTPRTVESSHARPWAEAGAN